MKVFSVCNEKISIKFNKLVIENSRTKGDPMMKFLNFNGIHIISNNAKLDRRGNYKASLLSISKVDRDEWIGEVPSLKTVKARCRWPA